MKTIILLGLALFSMFFGAGNLIFPLSLGQAVGAQASVATLGLVITAVVVPFLGLLAVLLAQGNLDRFFGKLGRWPGFCLALGLIALLGPLGSTPRCIALSFVSLKHLFPSLMLPLYCAGACGLLFVLSLYRERILGLLGWILTPALLISLVGIIVLGLWLPGEWSSAQPAGNAFALGLVEGYNTMDLLAAFFFASSILAWNKVSLQKALWGSVIGIGLLGLVYLGLSLIAAKHGVALAGLPKEKMLFHLTFLLAGSSAGWIVAITVALACLTTAIALISIFAEFIHRHAGISYRIALAASLLITFVVSTFEFSGISAVLGPALEILYPGLIVFTLWSIVYDMFAQRVKSVK